MALVLVLSACKMQAAGRFVTDIQTSEGGVLLPNDDVSAAEDGQLALPGSMVDTVRADQPQAADTLKTDKSLVLASDTLKQKKKRDWATWAPDPKKALWLSIVLPGAGQIYNRKFWKLPIIYGGMVGCIYALTWNNQMYSDYSQAYLDIMDDDPNTKSYEDFLHLGTQITPENTQRYKDLFKRRKDYYRKYRDLSVFALIAVYALSVIDAYVDASLSQFDISKDLSLKVEPAVVNSKSSRNPLRSSGLGVQCSLNF